jgi:hypothetical protein
LIFNFSLKYTIRKIQEYQLGLKLSGTHQLLAYTDEGNLLGDNRDMIPTCGHRHTHTHSMDPKVVRMTARIVYAFLKTCQVSN